METYSILMTPIERKATVIRLNLAKADKKRIANETAEANRIKNLREELGLSNGYTTKNFTKRDEQLRIHDMKKTNPVHWTTSFIKKQQAANCIW